MKRLASFFGSWIVFLLGCVVLTCLSLFVLGAFLMTYPLHRINPRDRRMRAMMDLVMAGAGVFAAFKPDEADTAPNGT